MQGFLYFLTVPGNVDDAAIEAAGLAGVLSTRGLSQRGTVAGPTGGAGKVCAAGAATSMDTFGYFPERQKWRSCQGGKFWLGMDTTLPRPTPRDLQREESVDGHWVKLADGEEWLIPIARKFPRGTALPEALDFGPDGELVSEVLPQYVKLSRDAERVWRAFRHQYNGEAVEGEQITIAEGFRIATAALAVNYRLGMDEVAMLRILTTGNLSRVLDAMIDEPTLVAMMRDHREASKKNGDALTPPGSTTASGVTDSSPEATPQPSPSSPSSPPTPAAAGAEP